MLINAAFHTGIWTLLFFIVGMIKPKWPLFFLKNPDRFKILIISTVLFMISATLYGEGNRQAKLEQAPKSAVSQSMDPASAPVPVPAPESKPESPKI
ncbi:MAG: hypothetical protein ISR72_08085 [Methylobacter sp.]|nr:hypothetical protein [Methylobacter sp.]